MANDQPLTPELDPGPPPLGARIRSLLAVPARLLGALVVPDRFVPTVVEKRHTTAALVAVVVCGLLSAYVVGARIDVTPKVLQDEAMAQKKAGPDFEGKSDRELKEEIAKGRTIEQVKLGLSAGLAQPVLIFLFALGIFFVGRLVGGRTTFGASMAAAAVAWLPRAVKSVVVGAMAWQSPTLTPADLDQLNSVAVLHGAGALATFSVSAFAVWAAVLLAFGLAAAAQISRRRAFITVFVWFACVLLIQGGIAGMTATPMPPGGAR